MASQKLEEVVCCVKPFLVALLFIVLLYLVQLYGVYLPQYVGVEVLLILLFVFALVLESTYLSVLGVMPNILLLYVLVDRSDLSFLMEAYLVLGVVLSAASYLLCKIGGISGLLYRVTYVLYSLKTVFAIYLSYAIFHSYSHPYFFYSVILLGVVSWALYAEAGI